MKLFSRITVIEQAIEREKEIKGMNRKKKEQLISTKNPHWHFLVP